MAAALVIGALALWFAPREALDWQPRAALSQPWRLWTAAFVHWSPTHLLANVLAATAVGAFGVSARVPASAAWAWFLAWPLSHAALLLQPQLLSYGGLSGMLHGGVAVVTLHLAWRETGQRRAIGVAVLAGMGVKLALEQPWLGPTQIDADWDIPLAPLGHLTGALCGLACGSVVLLIAPPSHATTTHEE